MNTGGRSAHYDSARNLSSRLLKMVQEKRAHTHRQAKSPLQSVWPGLCSYSREFCDHRGTARGSVCCLHKSHPPSSTSCNHQVGPHDQSYRTVQLHVTPTRFPVGMCHVVVFEAPCSSHRGHHIFRLQLQPHQGCSITRIALPKLSGTMPPITVTICDFQH